MSIQIKKKFIKSQVIDGSKVLFLNDDAFKALNSSGAEVELFKLDGSNKFQLLQMPQLSSDPVADEDISRKKYVDDSLEVEQLAREASDEVLQDQIDALSSSGGAAVAAVQSELDATQSGAGLSSSGAYVAPVGSNYLDTAVSLKDADSKLDVAVKAEETRALAAEGVIAADLAQEVLDRTADVDAEETRALAAESALDARLDIVEGDATTVGSIAKAEADAKSYADGIVATEQSAREAEDLTFVKLDGSRPMSGSLDMDGFAIDNVEGVRSNGILTLQSDASTGINIKHGLDPVTFYFDDGVDSVDHLEIKQVQDGVNWDSQINALSGNLKLEAASQIKAMAELSMESAKIVNVADPSAAQDAATKAYVDSRESAVTSAYQAYADQAEADAKAYADAEIAALVDAAPALLDTLNELAAAIGDDENFATTVANNIAAVQSAVDAEETRALAAEAAIQSELDATQTGAGLGTDGTYTANGAANYLSVAVSLKDADEKLDAQLKIVTDGLAQEIVDRIADVDAEETRALAAESALDARLDIIEGADTVEGSVAKAEKDAKDYTDAREVAITAAYEAYADQAEVDAKAYTDTAISNLVDGAPALLDTLNELAAAINDDANFAATIASQLGSLDSRADALEAASVEFKPVEKFVLSATDISNGYITLSYLAIQHSLRVSVDRLAIHQGAGNDYTVSTVGGVTRITFVNSLVTPGQEQLAANDEVYVEGAKIAIV